jgi:hypothetical protein
LFSQTSENVYGILLLLILIAEINVGNAKVFRISLRLQMINYNRARLDIGVSKQEYISAPRKVRDKDIYLKNVLPAPATYPENIIIIKCI